MKLVPSPTVLSTVTSPPDCLAKPPHDPAFEIDFSYERVFDARLAKVPVIVLSNNDGCAIARTSEAKALGIRMGEPWLTIRDACKAQGIRVYFSNYALYGDMSARVNAIYRNFPPRIAIYSIDENFLDISDVRERDRETLACDLRETVRAWTGIPTCVGIGATKTLAKLANHVAKKNPELGGVCDLTDPEQYDHWIIRVPVADIWGVGPANARRLEALGCDSAADVRDLDPRVARKTMTVVGERVVHELRGLACVDLEPVATTRKGCAVTRVVLGARHRGAGRRYPCVQARRQAPARGSRDELRHRLLPHQ